MGGASVVVDLSRSTSQFGSLARFCSVHNKSKPGGEFWDSGSWYTAPYLRWWLCDERGGYRVCYATFVS